MKETSQKLPMSKPNFRSIHLKRTLAMVLCFILCLFAIQPTLIKADSSLHLNETKLKLQVGNTYYLYLTTDSDTYDYWDYISCDWSSSDESVVTVQYGNIKVVGKGKATITATFDGKKYTCSVTASASSYRLTKYEINTKTYETVNFRMTHKEETYDYAYNVSQIMDNGELLDVNNAFYIDMDGSTGNIELQAQKVGNYQIDFYAYEISNDSNYDQQYLATCKVSVTAHGLIEQNLGCALGKKQSLTFGDLSQISFVVSNPAIATVATNGVVTPLALGETTVTMTGYNDLMELETYDCNLYVTDPKVSLDTTNIQLGSSIYFNIEEDSWYSNYTYASSNHSIIDVSRYGLNAVKEGSCTIAVTVDGKKFTFKVDVVDPKLSSETYLLCVSDTAKVKLTGLSASMKKEPIKYSVGNSRIATVSENGTITAKACGNTILTVKIKDYTLQASISVGNKISINAIKNAQKVLGSAYDQDKRMQTGYYDCSSLVWRSYAPAGCNMGSASYTPTAANLAKYLDDHGKTIATTGIDPKKLQPGDLIFYAGGYNGRFKNIYHVALFTGIAPGYDYNFETEESYNYYGTIIHAVHAGVVTSTVSQSDGSIVMIARPTK